MATTVQTDRKTGINASFFSRDRLNLKKNDQKESQEFLLKVADFQLVFNNEMLLISENIVSGITTGLSALFSSPKMPIQNMAALKETEYSSVREKLGLQLYKIKCLNQDWDSYGAEPPSAECIRTVEDFVRIAEKIAFLPTVLRPVPEDGIIIEYFKSKDNYIWIHIYNDLDIVYAECRNGEISSREATKAFKEGIDDFIRIIKISYEELL